MLAKSGRVGRRNCAARLPAAGACWAMRKVAAAVGLAEEAAARSHRSLPGMLFGSVLTGTAGTGLRRG
ncbi:hypothetical protein Amsp01_091470 [Amycolatopsis sp. NBRC 101858]|uniref:hypothetical protein n=1 Tax=Amycolatopsis sp. NBRC 101858 TaxID=3032200 RepID=UPI0024A2DDD8|nr:hypothetical protein [Amycolatopsis sp. NBRC 101858]GLY43124.1 hypothetical protein Amsp01_091470 [Amycolatopsis sp. NBRC 101858]